MANKKNNSMGLFLRVVVVVFFCVLGVSAYFGFRYPQSSSVFGWPITYDDIAPIVRDNNGVTEVSLKSAPNVVNKPTVDQLMEFRKRSEELTKEAAQNREKKIVRLRGVDIEVLPLYMFEEQKKGLIGVEFLSKNSGILYVFQMDDDGRGFGTKGMKFPLDYIWMNSDLQVVHLTKNVPPDFSDDVMSLWPARYVVETNAGFIDTNGIQAGDVATFENIPH